jgi:hypothetical protein
MFTAGEAHLLRLGEGHTHMGAAAIWEKLKSANGEDRKEHDGPIGAWIARLKKGLAAIAAAKSSQQFGREEEKE